MWIVFESDKLSIRCTEDSFTWCIFEFEVVKKRKLIKLLFFVNCRFWKEMNFFNSAASLCRRVSLRELITEVPAYGGSGIYGNIYIYFYQFCLLSLLLKSLCVCLMIPVLFWMFKMVLQVGWVWSLSVGLLRKPLVPPKTDVTLSPRISALRSSEERWHYNNELITMQRESNESDCLCVCVCVIFCRMWYLET